MASFLRGVLAHSAFRYAVVGVASFIVDFGLLWLLHEVVGWPVWLASGAAFLGSFVFNYYFQKAFAFSSPLGHGPALLRYGLLVGFNTLATMLLMQLLAATPLGWALAKVVTTGLTTLWNYFAYRYLVFPASPRSTEETPAR